jgi:hypothetical protein
LREFSRQPPSTSTKAKEDEKKRGGSKKAGEINVTNGRYIQQGKRRNENAST